MRSVAVCLAAVAAFAVLTPAPAEAVAGRGYGIGWGAVTCSTVEYRIAVPPKGRPTMFLVGYDGGYVFSVYLRRGQSFASEVDFSHVPGRHRVLIGVVGAGGLTRDVSKWTPTSCRRWNPRG